MGHRPGTLDRQPGALPEIRLVDDDVTYIVDPVGTPKGYQLFIRCNPNGDVWMAIKPESRSAAA